MTTSTLFPHPNSVRISVENFGPIGKGNVNLRPLTIFVGPSNTGKTYLAILIYALHRTLQGFHRFPFVDRHFFSHASDVIPLESDFTDFATTFDAKRKAIRFYDLPVAMRDFATRVLTDEDLLATALRIELERCFDLPSVYSLVRMPAKSNIARLSIAVSENEQKLWDFRLRLSRSKMKADGSIGNIEFNAAGELEYHRMYDTTLRLLHEYKATQGSDTHPRQIKWLVAEIWRMLSHSARQQHLESFYLPAARSGIMQSHRVIASSLVARSTRAGLERFPELPTFSGVMADFMQRLILYDAPVPPMRSRHRRNRPVEITGLADMLERQTLGGEIRTKRPSPGAYPEFVYRPSQANQDISLSRASSMVSELAPVVLFVRGNISGGDTLIIEEPEAHLHPAAQTEMAETLARLVTRGVRVVITTHSDWLLKGIGNLMREGDIREQYGESEGEHIDHHSLRPQDVGIWLFQKDSGTMSSTVSEIEFDPVEGIEPADYEDVADQLYNRSADLQNRMQEISYRRKT